jgi:hypothetical protein
LTERFYSIFGFLGEPWPKYRCFGKGPSSCDDGKGCTASEGAKKASKRIIKVFEEGSEALLCLEISTFRVVT